MVPWTAKSRFLSVLLVILATACAEKKPGSVLGKVLYKGKLVPSGTVVFISPDASTRSSAMVIDGHYLVTNLPAGPYKISVTTVGRIRPVPVAAKSELSTAPSLPGQGPPAFTPGPGLHRAEEIKQSIKVPERFADVERSGLTYSVLHGKQQHDIDLDTAEPEPEVKPTAKTKK